MVRFQPFSFAIQTRFKWRHKETDRWRRLMDGTCFSVDWMTQTFGNNMSQHSGNWSHILTCAHVVCPWNYPNYYPPTGHTRFVSHITLADTQTQVRVPSLQGNIVYRHFVSNHSVFVHTNPRLDLCVVHPEQLMKRSGETKMLWLQNEGLTMRPRIELNEELQVGDYVWIYGMTAHESLFDEEKAPEPLMIPTGIRARVHAKTREHFFLDTLNVEGAEKGRVNMGMCGSVIMRGGKCVGMLTATVHEESNCKELAGTAMCTYASDIFEFLLEVETQLKNTMPQEVNTETQFEAKRREEGRSTKEHRDWSLDHTRIARHIEVPKSLWRMEERWMTEEDVMTSKVFGTSGVFNQETQENTLGLDMNSSKVGEMPSGAVPFSTSHKGGRAHVQGERRDDSPTGVYVAPEDAKKTDQWSATSSEDMRELFNDHATDPREISLLNGVRQSMEHARIVKEREKMRENVFKHAASRNAAGYTDPLNAGTTAHYGGAPSAGADNFESEAWEEDRKWRSAQAQSANTGTHEAPHEQEWSPAQPQHQAGFEQRWDDASKGSEPPTDAHQANTRSKRQRQDKEREYQEALRQRHSQYQPESFGDWGRH